MPADLTTGVGVGASIFTAVALLPQLVRLIKAKQPGDISPLMLGSLFIGVALWVLYGALKQDWIIIISNAFSLVVNVLISVFTFIYKGRYQRTEGN